MHSPELPIEPFALFFFLGIIIILNTAKKIKKNYVENLEKVGPAG